MQTTLISLVPSVGDSVRQLRTAANSAGIGVTAPGVHSGGHTAQKWGGPNQPQAPSEKQHLEMMGNIWPAFFVLNLA